MRVLGLMSGTSADGVDAVLARFSGPPGRPRWSVLASAHHPYPGDLRRALIAVGQGQAISSAALLDLAEAVTDAQAAAATACDPLGRADLIGCHGQTLWHRPPTTDRPGNSWQLLQGPRLAQRLRRPVVFDFRSQDLALGGEGAPLVPATDQALLPPLAGWRAVLNLGGIANLTLLPPCRGPERKAAVRGWDCGPANTLLDLAVQGFSAGRLTFDADGAWAALGQVNEPLVSRWLMEPYLQRTPPKSTGRELFGVADLQRRLAALGLTLPAAGASPRLPSPGPVADALATLTAFTAAAIAQDLARQPTAPLELVVAGGGSRNPTLLRDLRQRCRGVWLRPLADLGVAEQEREALAFALLAWWQWRGHPGSLPSVTGASKEAVLGVRADPGEALRRPGPGLMARPQRSA
ncbi:MAG: anhydro-N-acetylmuramic acid kinase [Cyanobacteriota bacterium]